MRIHISLCATIVAAAFGCSTAQAQESTYPNRPITFVVPLGTGGPTDTSARLYAKVISDKIGRAILVENKPGGSAILGTQHVAQAKPDGYTMLYGTSGPLGTYAALYKKTNLHYETLKSFAPVHGLSNVSPMLLVNASKPYKTLEEFVEYIKKNPGKVNFGTGALGGATHLPGEMLQTAISGTMTTIPYKLSANMYADLFSGTIDAVFDYPSTMKQHIEDGKLIPLATTAKQRSRIYPNVPTFVERDIDVDFSGWSVIVMPAATPPEAVNKMSAAVAEAFKDPVVIKYLNDNDFISLGHLGPDKLREFIVSEIARLHAVVEKAGVRLD